MWLQIIAGAGWLIWLISGTAGLEKGLTVGALLVLGLGMKNIGAEGDGTHGSWSGF